MTPEVIGRAPDCSTWLSDADVRIGSMPLCDYFSAAGDQAAVSVLRTLGGPGPAGLDAVFLKNIDPVVSVARLEAVMTGCGFEEASERPRSGQLLSSPECEPFVVSVSDSLADALAAASPEDLVRFAEPWARTDELRQLGISAEDTLDVLEALAGLAQRARASDQRLYCWWAL
ncbi:hypothetical protein ACFQ6N_17410 [Kitasatospora sp. NPDC056446]|uniref:hypothetical protein n=1 Tax=Kitasatospora sp. NPDC056446 TaxID=3345819 RepID=UPI0036995758